jgi:D-alanyl-D-alanine carboxypeptidase (penicillin-binding protein 5/6)
MIRAKAAFLLDMNTGRVLYSQDADKPIAPASITKVLTLYLTREALAQGRLRPDTTIPVSSLAVHTGGSTMSLYKGEKVPVSELIKGISVVSANNACVAVAEYMGKGNSRAFVARMNATARALGMTHSEFKNPNGLPASGQFTTARDIAKLSASYLRRFPESLAIHSMTSYTYNGVTHHNANSLLGRYEGVDGLKTGFVCASGYNITATAKRGKTRLVAVVLGAANPIIRETETAKLLDYGFTTVDQCPAPAKGNIRASN